MCDVTDWLGGIAAISGAAVAWLALDTWKTQLKGTNRHQAATELGIAVRTLSIKFFEARVVMIEPFEFPGDYYELPQGTQRSNTEEADALLHVYKNRWLELWPHIKALADLRPKVGTVLGDDVLQASEELATTARQLWFWMEHAVAVRRAGEGVHQWTDQTFVAQIRPHVHTPDESDAYSIEFIAKRQTVIDLIKPALEM